MIETCHVVLKIIYAPRPPPSLLYIPSIYVCSDHRESTYSTFKFNFKFVEIKGRGAILKNVSFVNEHAPHHGFQQGEVEDFRAPS